MSNKTYISEGEQPPASQIGATLEALAATITARRNAGEESYTYRLLSGSPDDVLKKVMEESGEVALAAKDVEYFRSVALANNEEAASAAASSTSSCPSTAAGRVEAQSSLVSGQSKAPEAALLTSCDQQANAVDQAIDHLRYEAADVVYHLMVVLERYGIDLDEFAAELNCRMTDEERPCGGVRLRDDRINRGK